MIYMVIYFSFVLVAAPSRPLSLQRSSASVAMNMKTHPSARGRKELYPLSLSSSEREAASHPQPRRDRLEAQTLWQHLSL